MAKSSSEKIDSQLYCVKMKENLYFVLTKVTPNNISNWKNFYHCQIELKQKYFKERKTHSVFKRLARNHKSTMFHLSKGLAGMEDSLRFYDEMNGKFELWIAYASSKEVTDPNELDIKNVLLAVTTGTSHLESGREFITNMGIVTSAFNLCYNENLHKGLAVRIFAFAAHMMQEIYARPKYVITTPVGGMRNILVKALEDKGIIDGLHICFDNEKITSETLEELEKKKADYEPYYECTKDPNWSEIEPIYALYNLKCLNIALRKQKERKYIPPIEFKGYGDDEDENNRIFIIKDKEGKVLLEIDKKSQDTEFQWLFKSWNCQAPFPNIGTDPLICCDIEALKKLIEIKNPIKHFKSTEEKIDSKLISENFEKQIKDFYKDLENLEKIEALKELEQKQTTMELQIPGKGSSEKSQNM